MTIQSAQITPDFRPREMTVAKEEQAEGLFMGARVTQDDPMSLLADAAEELTFSLAETEENRLDERKEKAGPKSTKDLLIDAARMKTQEADEKFGRAVDSLERLFKARNSAALSELMEALGQLDEREGKPGAGQDPADQFALLCALKDRLGASHPLAGSLDQALEELADKESFAVASGFAVDSVATAFSGLGANDKLRSAYRSAVADFASPRDVLARVRETFGDDKLEQGLDFLMTTLGHELSSSGPSVEKERLKALTHDLSAARILGLVRTRCEALLERLHSVHGSPARVSPDKLLDSLLTMRDNQYAGLRDVQGIAAMVGINGVEHEVLFLQDMLQGLRDLPDLFYDGQEGRSRVQGAVQTALDDAVRREEEELGF